MTQLSNLKGWLLIEDHIHNINFLLPIFTVFEIMKVDCEISFINSKNVEANIFYVIDTHGHTRWQTCFSWRFTTNLPRQHFDDASPISGGTESQFGPGENYIIGTHVKGCNFQNVPYIMNIKKRYSVIPTFPGLPFDYGPGLYPLWPLSLHLSLSLSPSFSLWI